jgi:hypothetical protein
MSKKGLPVRTGASDRVPAFSLVTFVAYDMSNPKFGFEFVSAFKNNVARVKPHGGDTQDLF